MVDIRPVVLCGGEGTRLWPASTPERPKQFLALTGARSSFQEAVGRLHGRPGVHDPLIVAGAAHEEIVRAQLDALGFKATLLLEPKPLGSAVAVGLAAAFYDQFAPESVVVVLPSDHHIPDDGMLWNSLCRAVSAAEAGFIATLGITPKEASTSFGYIAPGDSIAGCPDCQRVDRFVEKPPVEDAREYVARGFLWNSGIFVFRPRVLLTEMKRFAPELESAVRAAVDGVRDVEACVTAHLSSDWFERIGCKSLDYVVMEHTRQAAVTAAAFPWSDVGTWGTVWSLSPKDEDGNSIAGDSVAQSGNEDCLIRSSGTPVAVLGLRNAAVIVDEGGVLVCDLAASQSVKLAVEHFRKQRRLHDSSQLGQFHDLAEASGALSRWLDTSALPLWWTLGADHERGGFHELIGQNAQPVSANRRMRVQARQAHVYARAVDEGWNGPGRAASSYAMSYLVDRYRRDDGFFRTLVSDDGVPVDDTALLYDQAFVLLALSASYGLGDASAAYRARALVDQLESGWRHRLGGFRATRDEGAPLLSNPHMHMLEAVLAWHAIEPEGDWLSLARSLVELCRDRFIDFATGAVVELYPEESGARVATRIEPGHQFEWAHLLLRYSELGNHPEIAAWTVSLYDIGAQSVDTSRGVAVDALSADLSIREPQARLWPQTERARAALALARRERTIVNRAAYEEDALSAFRSIARYLDTDVPGLWWDKMRADGSLVREPSPASSLYHLASAIWDLRDYCVLAG